MTLEIFFEDLNEETQKKVLAFFDVESEEEGNLNIIPLLALENDSEEENGEKRE